MKIYRITEYDRYGRRLSCEHFATKKEVNIRMKERKSSQHSKVDIEIISQPWGLNHFYSPVKLDRAERKIEKLEDKIIKAMMELKK